MWKGSISFGLVNIPIAVYLATEGREFSFNQLCSKAHKIRYKKWCPVEEREVSYSEIKKDYILLGCELVSDSEFTIGCSYRCYRTLSIPSSQVPNLFSAPKTISSFPI